MHSDLSGGQRDRQKCRLECVSQVVLVLGL